ncbi:MAG: DHA2 family efflux MFS transporter permease subunit [Chlamydiota bacterium]
MSNTALFTALFIAIGFVSGNNTLPIIASPYIVGDLGGSNDIAFYAITFYNIGNALGVPIGKACIGRVKPHIYYLIVMSLFAFFTWSCAVVPTYPLFLICRVLQGIMAGSVFPLSAKIFFQLSPPENSNLISTIMVTIFTVVPSFCAAWGGWISYDHHWQELFYFNTPPLLLLGLYLFYKLKDRDIPLEKEPFDKWGYLSYALCVVSFSLVLTMGQQLDWHRSPIIVSLAALCVLSLGFFIPWELNTTHPLLDLRMLKKFTFSFALLNLALLFSAYFGIVLLLAYWLNLWVSYTPNWIALMIGTMAFAGFLPTFLLRKGYHRIDCRIPLIIAVALLAISCFYTTTFNVEINFGRIAFSRLLAGFGLAFFLAPIFRLCFHSFAPAQMLSVVSYFQLVRMLSSGLGAAVYLTIWQRREVFFHERLGEELTPFSPITDQYYQDAKALDITGQEATAELGALLDRQSIALALDDCFYLMAWVLTGLLALILITRIFKCRGFIPENCESGDV